MPFILLGWIAAVAVVLAFVIKPWKSAAHRAPLPMILALAVSAWGLGSGAIIYNDLMAQGSWTAASLTIGFVPAKAIIFALLAYALGRTFNAARATSGPPVARWGVPAVLTVVLMYVLGTDVAANWDARLESHARSTTLSAQDVSALAAKIRDGRATKGEQGEFLGNPLCPPDLLEEFASSPEPYWRRAVARNDKLDHGLIEKLLQDPDEEVRYFLAFNRDLPVPLLSRLAADKSERVREVVVWTRNLPDADYAKLTRDPSAKVRESTARQERTSMEDWARLRDDPDERVRTAARRWDAQ
jgi:hypothetical protein